MNRHDSGILPPARRNQKTPPPTRKDKSTNQQLLSWLQSYFQAPTKSEHKQCVSIVGSGVEQTPGRCGRQVHRDTTQPTLLVRANYFSILRCPKGEGHPNEIGDFQKTSSFDLARSPPSEKDRTFAFLRGYFSKKHGCFALAR